MDKTQEEKFEKWYAAPWVKGPEGPGEALKMAWAACLEANGIGESKNMVKPNEGVVQSSSAPEWVIDMMRTGKPIRCKVWDVCEDTTMYEDVTGYDISSNYPFIGENQEWKHAEPVPSWKPKDWEQVIFAKPEDDTVLLGVYYKGEIHCGDLYYTADGMRYAELDIDKLGKPWSEI